MIVARVYDVLDHTVVEITCSGHSEDPGHTGHLVFRAQGRSYGHSVQSKMQDLVDAAWEARQRLVSGEIEETDDCSYA